MRKTKRVFLTPEQLMNAYTIFKSGETLKNIAKSYKCNIKTVSNWMSMIEKKLDGRKVNAGRRKQVLTDTIKLIMTATPEPTEQSFNHLVLYSTNVIDAFIGDLRQQMSYREKKAELQLGIRKLQEAKFWLSEAGV